MAGKCKPDIKNLGPEGKIIFVNKGETYGRGIFDRLDSLLDGDLNGKTGYGCLFDTYTEGEGSFEFELPQNSNIYAYGQHYYDSGGVTPSYANLYVKTSDEEWKPILNDIQTKSNEWYLLASNLEKGKYKIEATGNYVQFTEWYIEALKETKYLIKKDDLYYSIKPEFFNKENDFNPCSYDINKNGFSNIKDLLKPISVEGYNVKPIECFKGKLEIIKFKEK